MSELINIHDPRAVIRRQLLATASAMALVSYIASASAAAADDTDRPTVWIELGGQIEMTQGTTSPFIAPFMALNPTPDVYSGVPLATLQRPSAIGIGAEGEISFAPKGSDWVFSVGVRYGRSHAKRHAHNQLGVPPVPWNLTYAGNVYPYTKYISTAKLADAQTEYSEQHFIVDFSAGRDVGIGRFGRDGSSTLGAGVRFASFVAHSFAHVSARPEVDTVFASVYGFHIPRPTFHQYTMIASAERSFRGIGPSLSWNASAVLLGNAESSELSLDWGINAALLFGKQKAKVAHTTQAYHQTTGQGYLLTAYLPHHTTRSRSVAVPNLGGFAGLSVKYPNGKVSFGYRADFFFGAMDTGIDTRNTKDVGFHGPFATVSIGLGG